MSSFVFYGFWPKCFSLMIIISFFSWRFLELFQAYHLCTVSICCLLSCATRRGVYNESLSLLSSCYGAWEEALSTAFVLCFLLLPKQLVFIFCIIKHEYINGSNIIKYFDIYKLDKCLITRMLTLSTKASRCDKAPRIVSVRDRMCLGFLLKSIPPSPHH